jgi:hypothetical protein
VGRRVMKDDDRDFGPVIGFVLIVILLLIIARA